MPPEPLPWDRKELFRDRKHGHDRSEPFGPVARWRETSSSSSSSFHGGGSRNHDFNPRWGYPSPSDFRRPPGHGRQGGWHMYPEDSAFGYPTARSGDRFLDDNGFRPSGPRGDGRYGKVYRETRTSFGQKDWRGHSWETNHHHSVPPNASGRLHIVKDQRSDGDSPLHASDAHSDPCDQFHSKEEDNKTTHANGSDTRQRVDKENSLECLDWKPLKWSRSGSLMSRGSGNSGSKSVGGESSDVKCDLPPKNVTPVRSSSVGPVACAPPVVQSEEASRKKPRLGWGEGLAKYEKKKVEGPEENVNKVGNQASLSNVELIHSLTSNLADKSPRVTGFSDCSSPTTPSSFACSSSPGLEDKTYGKTTEDGDANNFSASSMPVSENQLEGLHFRLEKLELDSIANLSSLLDELLLADDQCSMDSGFVRSSAVNKLLVWKGELSKALELTETEIDSLENELKALKSDSERSCPCPASSYSRFADNKEEPIEDLSVFPRPPSLEVVSSGDMIMEDALPCDNTRWAHTGNKDDDIDSPGTSTSKFVEELSSKKLSPDGWKNSFTGDPCSLESTQSASENLPMYVVSEKTVGIPCLVDGRKMIQEDRVASRIGNLGICNQKEESICHTILTSNKDSATMASEVLVKLLPSCDYRVDTPEANIAPCLPADLTSKEKFLKRKRFLRFKERVLSLKYRALQHQWKEGLCVNSSRSHRTKPQKKFDLSTRTMQSGNHKHGSSNRARFVSPAASLSLIAGKLLSDSQVKIYRSCLKMPTMILDDKEKTFSRFASSNGLVEDPCAVEKERALINPWTPEEKELFMDKLGTHGKDFKKISSFLDHKTTADCIEFYYKNHKSVSFEKTKTKLDLKKQGKPLSTNTYLVTSGKRWSREMNAASLDILGEASAIAAQADKAMEPSGKSSNKKSRGILERSNSYYIAEDERENAAADVLAGICGSLSSEAMSSCITSSIDPREGNPDWKHQNFVDDDTYSDESCGEMDPVDWTDDEKSLFVQAFSTHGKDFSILSRCVRTKTRDQCKVFFSKARKCLGLEALHPGITTSNEKKGGSGPDYGGVVETSSLVCSDKSDLQNINPDVSKPESAQLDHKEGDSKPHDLIPGDREADVSELAAPDDGVVDAQAQAASIAGNIARCGVHLIDPDDKSKVGAIVDVEGAREESESSEVFKGFPLDMSIIKAEMVNGVVTHKPGSEFDRRDCYLRKCESQNSVAQLPLFNHHSDDGGGSSKKEKPCGNGDVKLFGKILSKVDKPTRSSSENDDKHEHHSSFLGLEKVPLKSFRFWDGSKIQTGFPSLPDLLAKYPAAFANYSKTDENPNECNMNGACVFSPTSNGDVNDYPVTLNGVQEDMDSYTGISDPVAAFKLHYASRTQQYGNGGHGVIREESWKCGEGEGDVRR